jgi:hypothetical protein
MRPGLEGFEEVYESQELLLRRASAGAELRAERFADEDQFRFSRSITLRLQLVRSLDTDDRGERPRLAATDQPSLSPTAFVLIDQRAWSSATRTGRLDYRQLAVEFTTAEAQRRWEELGSPSLLPRSPTGIAPSGEYTHLLGTIALSRSELHEFPTDPHVICERLLATRPDDPPKVLSQLIEALRSGPKPAALRGGIYRALLLQPTVVARGTARDGAGREGIALRYVREDQDRDHENELILDPRSFELLGTRTRMLGNWAGRLGIPEGSVTENTVMLEHNVTNDIPAELD